MSYIYPLQAAVVGVTIGIYSARINKKYTHLERIVALIACTVIFGGCSLLCGILSKSTISFLARKLGYESVGLGGNLAGAVLQAVLTYLGILVIGKIADAK